MREKMHYVGAQLVLETIEARITIAEVRVRGQKLKRQDYVVRSWHERHCVSGFLDVGMVDVGLVVVLIRLVFIWFVPYLAQVQWSLGWIIRSRIFVIQIRTCEAISTKVQICK